MNREGFGVGAGVGLVADDASSDFDVVVPSMASFNCSVMRDENMLRSDHRLSKESTFCRCGGEYDR